MPHSNAVIRYILFLGLISNPLLNIYADQANTATSNQATLPLGVPETKSPPQKKGWLDGYTIMPSLMVKNISFTYVDYDNVNWSERYAPAATMIENNHLAPGITIRSPISYSGRFIRGLNIGSFFEIAFSTFQATIQQISYGTSQSEQDLGTEVHGKYLDLVYMLYVQYRDTYFVTDKKHAIRFGLGGGMGYVRAKGNVYLTENIPEWQKVNVDFEENNITLKGIIEYQYGDFLLSIKDHGRVSLFTGPKTGLRERSIEAAYVYEF